MRRALKRGNLLAAEATLGEVGRPTLDELLELTGLICANQPARGRCAAARFLELYLGATSPTIEEANLVGSLLAALGSSRHQQALTSLQDMLQATTSARSVSDVGSAQADASGAEALGRPARVRPPRAG